MNCSAFELAQVCTRKKRANAHLTVKGAIASTALVGPRPLAYRVIHLQTKPYEQIRPLIFSYKEKNCICQNGHNLSY